MNSHLMRQRYALRLRLSQSLQVGLLVVGTLITGCHRHTEVADQPGIAGTYSLVSVNGLKVPATVMHNGVNLQVRSGTFTINTDGTCSTKTVFVPPSGTEATREVRATYTRDGSKLNMKWQGAGVTSGTVQGNTFTMDNEGIVLAYTK